jgi:hypothetical protein|tara:strand:+ start:122 stop:418 length:297 start_codon:yes stop_codon:yes gene_type:complete
MRESKVGTAFDVLSQLKVKKKLMHTYTKNMEIKIAKSIADASFYYLAATHIKELQKILTCLRWIQARFVLETTLGGLFGVVGLVTDFQLSAEHINKYR